MATSRFQIKNPGALNQRIELQRKTGADAQGWGDYDGNYVTISTRWARIEYKSGSEAIEYGRPESQSDVIIYIRHTSDIRVSDRVYVRSDGRYLNIEAITDIDMKKRWLELRCTYVSGQDSHAIRN